MTEELQSTHETSRIVWPASRNHMPCIVHIIPHTLGTSRIRLRVKCRTESWEAHEGDQLFGEIESTDIGKSQKLREEGNARLNKVLAMKPDLAKIIEKVRI